MTSTKPCVSIVLPVYNVGKFIDKCIANLQAQTLKNLEFVFVDDCGNDDSINRIEKYAEYDNRIKIVHNEHNKGAGATRNHGISVATGEYISFVDPDDWMNPEFYEVLYSNAISGDFDIVKGRRIDVVERRNGEIRYVDNGQNQSAKSAMCQGYPLYSGFIHGHQSAIYRLDMVRKYNAHYSDTSFGECGMFILTACCHTNRVCFVEGAYYYYLQHEDSSAHVMSWVKYESELKAVFEQMEFAKQELKNNIGLNKFLQAKLNFLLWRYKELKQNKLLINYRKKYLITIWNELCAIQSREQKVYFFKRLLPIRVISLCRKVVNVFRKIFFRKRVFNLDSIDFSGRKIAYKQNFRGSVFFCKKFTEIDADFAYHFLHDFHDYSGSFNNELEVGCELYNEHLKYSERGELCWKYIRRLGHISKIVIYLNENSELCMRGEILDHNGILESRNHILLAQPTRKIIPGRTLNQYLLSFGDNKEEVYGELCQFLDFVFEKYATSDKNLIQGIAFDACPRNCILKEGHKYELFDFEYEYKQPLERGFFIYLATLGISTSIREWVYYHLCEYYGVVPKQKYWETMIDQGWIEIMDNTTDCKYFLK